MPTKIESIEQLKKESAKAAYFFIALCGPLRSSKRIEYDKESGIFHIYNGIDDTYQRLTEKQVMDRDNTLIGKAINKGSFYKDDTD